MATSARVYRAFLVLWSLVSFGYSLGQAQPSGRPAASLSTTSEPTPVAAGDETSDSRVHVAATAYLWFPGVHGTLGVRGFQTGVHVSPTDLLSSFHFGLMGAFTTSYNRFSIPIDYFFVRLKDDKSIPASPDYTVTAKITESIVTPKVAYLFVNQPKIKIYGNMGPRIWHLGTTLSLDPTLAGFNPSKSVTWTDFVAGARFSVPVGPKLSIDLLGDAGEGGATLDYQLAGFANYQVKPKLALQAGWRYLTVHYGNNGNFFNGTTDGIIVGATYRFK